MHLAHPPRARPLISFATAALALALAATGCDDPAPTSATPNAAGSAAPAPSAAASSASLDASAPDAPNVTAGQGGAAPDASPLTDTPPAVSGTAPPKEAATGAASAKPDTKAKTDATATAKPSAAAAKPDAGAPADAGAVASGGGEGATPKPGTSATPADLPPPAPGSADAIAAQIDAIFVGKKTFKARFKQEHTQKVSGVVKKQSGTLFVEKPNKISFRYDPPSQNRIVSDGSSLKIYIAEDTQMFVQPVAKTEYPGALAFLMGNGLRPSFTFTINDKAKFEGGPVILGKPRSPTPHYEYVMFYVDKALLEKGDPNAVRRVLIVDAQGNKNRFDFEGASQPASIDPGEFVFNPPAGTTISNDAKK